jgi:hypothetical protein
MLLFKLNGTTKIKHKVGSVIIPELESLGFALIYFNKPEKYINTCFELYLHIQYHFHINGSVGGGKKGMTRGWSNKSN